jgi:hypothetical protein
VIAESGDDLPWQLLMEDRSGFTAALLNAANQASNLGRKHISPLSAALRGGSIYADQRAAWLARRLRMEHLNQYYYDGSLPLENCAAYRRNITADVLLTRGVEVDLLAKNVTVKKFPLSMSLLPTDALTLSTVKFGMFIYRFESDLLRNKLENCVKEQIQYNVRLGQVLIPRFLSRAIGFPKDIVRLCFGYLAIEEPKKWR